MRPLRKREIEVLHHLIKAKEISEIAILLNRSEKTINDYRRRLNRFFDANNRMELIRKAFLYGYCDDLLKEKSKLRPDLKITPFKIDQMQEIKILHDLIRGYSIHELGRKYSMKIDDVRLSYVVICRQLCIHYEEDIFIHSLVVGYISLTPVKYEDFNKKEIKTKIEEWAEGFGALKLPKYRIEFEYFLSDTDG